MEAKIPLSCDFVHLHCHTDRSLLDGVGKSIEYAEISARNKQKAIAITDHGVLYGLPEHKKACERVGVKPIYGCELYVADKRDEDKSVLQDARKAKKLQSDKYDPTFTDAHLVVLAADQTGWQNLLRINHDSVINGYYYKPRTTHDFVCQHAEGLIATTACMGSLFGKLALQPNVEPLRALLKQFKDAFKDRFYYEIHVNEVPEQKKINTILAHECKRLAIKPILTCDVHYACASDVNRQEEMVAVSRHTKLDDPDAFKIGARHLWFARPIDAWGLSMNLGMGIDKGVFRQAILNTVEVSEKCKVQIYNDNTLKPPTFKLDSGVDVKNPYLYLERKATAGFNKLFSDRAPKYLARLKHELSVIQKCGMSAFYLVTMDIVAKCRADGIFVWTRGSGCASLVACCVGITSIDPIRFGLLFERFVDPSRPNAPDFDLDIDANRRQEVIDWMVTKYGGVNGENIARIISFQTFGVKSALRDVFAARGIDSKVAFSISSASDGLPPTVETRLAESTLSDRKAAIDNAISELGKLDSEPVTKALADHPEIMRAALTMVGRVRNRSTHPAGYVVAPGPLIEHIPIDKANGNIVTAWGEGLAAQDISETGLMKIDLLALDTCTVVSNCLRLIASRNQRDIAEVYAEVETVNSKFDDPKTMGEYRRGVGFGLHQFGNEDQYLAGVSKKLKPKSVDEVIALIALYRPGSLPFIDDFLNRARGKAQFEPIHKLYDKHVTETYGIIIYQEQIMLILHELGGFPLRDAYKIIKNISKQQAKPIQEARAKFMSHATKVQRMTPEAAAEVFDTVERFAGYGFNKAHSASYGVLSYITAYLRANYPLEFWASWLSEISNTSGTGESRKIELFMRAASSNGIKLRPPIVGWSTSRWKILKDGSLLAPLSLVLGVGDKAAELSNDAFIDLKWKDFNDFLAWSELNRRTINSKALLAIAKAGGFRRWIPSTVRAVDCVAQFVSIKGTKTNLASAQFAKRYATNSAAFCTSIEDEATSMVYERHAFGFSFFNSPWSINRRREIVERLWELGNVARDEERKLKGRRRAFQISKVTPHTDKKGGKMAFLTLSTLGGSVVRAVCFSQIWEKYGKSLRQDGVYLIRGEYDNRNQYVVSKPFGPNSPFRSVDSLADKVLGGALENRTS